MKSSLTQFIALEKERREIEERLDGLKKEQAAVADDILEEWTASGQQSANIDGFCCYVAKDFVCGKKGDVETEHLIEVLREAGLAQCVQVGYNAASLKSWIKESLANESAIPEPLAACLNYQTIPRLRARLA